MLLTINLRKLSEVNLSPNGYVLCYFLYHKDYTSLKEYVTWLTTEELIALLNKLESLKFIKIGCDLHKSIEFEKIYTRQSFIDLMEIDDNGPNYFEELRSVYPKDTPNGRKLHVNLQKAKKKYLSFLKGNLNLHSLILKCVELEVKRRTDNNGLNYMQNISTYINNENWSPYMEDVLKIEERRKNGQPESDNEGNKWVNIL